MPRKGRPKRVTGTFPEALKQGRTAMPYQKNILLRPFRAG
uniref:Uncharacterized protein n=1 Tax=Siphoviridae sp. ct5co22 TaxID=2826294 RepID=A0A8S5QTG8_9CAUD|nr:MAG TPA: hypothetical protein [Siphoviridae sp. ct5co22]